MKWEEVRARREMAYCDSRDFFLPNLEGYSQELSSTNIPWFLIDEREIREFNRELR